MIIEIHTLTNFSASCLNRDESGAPKTCIFGGTQRGRISSQCLKHAWRTSDIMTAAAGENGIRTRLMPDAVAKILKEKGMPEDMIEKSKVILTGVGSKTGEPNKKGIATRQIINYMPYEIEAMADALITIYKEKCNENMKEYAKTNPEKELADLVRMVESRVPADTALFGRMVTSNLFTDIDASMQVAHAISTHTTARQSDYFTAVDDLISQGEDENASGTAMIEDADYNSSCYYSYASIDLDALVRNLGIGNKMPENERLEVAANIVRAMIRTMTFVTPSGKQNSFAAHALPDLLMVECKPYKIPTSYVNAFESPVSTWGTNPEVVRESVKRLAEHVDMIDRTYGIDVSMRGVLCPRFKNVQPAKSTSFDTLEGLIQACMHEIEG